MQCPYHPTLILLLWLDCHFWIVMFTWPISSSWRNMLESYTEFCPASFYQHKMGVAEKILVLKCTVGWGHTHSKIFLNNEGFPSPYFQFSSFYMYVIFITSSRRWIRKWLNRERRISSLVIPKTNKSQSTPAGSSFHCCNCFLNFWMREHFNTIILSLIDRGMRPQQICWV